MSQGVLLESEAKPTLLNSVSMAFMALCLGHLVVDALATLLPASLGLIEVRAGLTPAQSAWLLGMGSFTSGLAQPIGALISDRYRTRVISVVGIAMAGVGFAALGLAETSTLLGAAFMFGMIGQGMFHPIAATTVAQLYRERRNAAASTFFVAGMVGGVLGAMLWPRWLKTSWGFETLPVILVPCLVLALFVQRCHAALPPVAKHAKEDLDLALVAKNWADVWYLYASSALRYCVNTALVYLFVRWAENQAQLAHSALSKKEVAEIASPIVGNLNAAMILGMAVGGILVGKWVHPNRERLPMIWVPIVFSPVVAFFPHMSIWGSYVLAFLAGIGFSSMIPISVAMAQHLLPHRANLASSLMMGGAWTVATIGPRCAEFGVTHWGLNTTFLLTACVLAASGIVCVGMNKTPHGKNTG
jgi:FSR family fosmidomycin resistance protein-like MFS transporter